MSKASYPYPEDEFDSSVDPSSPRGVHRAPRSTWSRVWPFLLVLVIFGGLAYAGVTWAARDDGSPSGAGTPSSSAPAEAPESTESESAAEPEEPEPSDTESEEPAPEPDLTTPVEVLNASGISGLAGRTAESLTAAGFTTVATGNAASTPAESTVFYATAQDEATAALVAETIGITTVRESAQDAGDGIVVVLTSDPDA